METKTVYNAPELEITSAEDIITASKGDTPIVHMEW